MKKLYIGEFRPAPSTDYEGDWREDKFHDRSLHLDFYVMKEPEGIHLEKDKLYEFRFLTPTGLGSDWDYYNFDPADSSVYKVWERIDDKTVIIAQWDVLEGDWWKDTPEEEKEREYIGFSFNTPEQYAKEYRDKHK